MFSAPCALEGLALGFELVKVLALSGSGIGRAPAEKGLVRGATGRGPADCGRDRGALPGREGTEKISLTSSANVGASVETVAAELGRVCRFPCHEP